MIAFLHGFRVFFQDQECNCFVHLHRKTHQCILKIVQTSVLSRVLVCFMFDIVSKTHAPLTPVEDPPVAETFGGRGACKNVISDMIRYDQTYKITIKNENVR